MISNENKITANVIGTYGAYYIIQDNNDVSIKLKAKLRGKLRFGNHDKDYNRFAHESVLAIGDSVEAQVLHDSDEVEAYILSLNSRRNSFKRASYDRVQLLGCNIDRVFLICAIEQPMFRYGFLDRVLVEAENANIPITIVVNKWDLVSKEQEIDYQEAIDKIKGYESLGYSIYKEKFIESASQELLVDLTTQRVLLVGQSGVGKSTLLNLAVGSKAQAVKAVGTRNKGQHTTTNSVLYQLPNGGELIDVPGMREFGLQHLNVEQVGKGFREFRSHPCRFENCIHENEPNCGVKEALANGLILPWRYHSYLSLLEKNEEVYKIRKGNYWKT